MIALEWKRFASFRQAREAFRGTTCIYAVTDREERILKIGESGDLWTRYVGGTGYTVDAAMHGSGNLVFVAAAPLDEQPGGCRQIHPSEIL